MDTLPEELRGLICLNLDIETIENLCLCYKKDLLPETHFWIDYFKLYNLNIVNEHNNIVDWIKEFKVAGIISLSESNIPDYSLMSLEKQAHYRSWFCIQYDKIRNMYPNIILPKISTTLSLKEI